MDRVAVFIHMIDVIQIIKQFYTTDSELYNLLLKHSSSVANKALEIAEDAKLSVDKEFIYEGAMLHDIGIYKTYAPSIYCNGTEKYISHGVIGAEILRSLGLEAHARISERHTGSGLTATEIASARLPLPIRDMLPVTVEERLICYADMQI
ncbi:MAG: HDIG domain-containing protein [Bacteroidales bacterium]